MKVPHNFVLYITAVKMANIHSQGSGELNKFDHVAKDLHKPEWEEEYDKINESEKMTAIKKYGYLINEMASMYETA